jgi:tetratricopeptide (TPR) repeat protein
LLRDSFSSCPKKLLEHLKFWGKLDTAMELLKKQEALCIELGNKNSLQASYGNQALILLDLGKPEEAVALFKKQENICKKAGLVPSLIWCYRNQIDLFEKAIRSTEALEVRKKLDALENGQ